MAEPYRPERCILCGRAVVPVGRGVKVGEKLDRFGIVVGPVHADGCPPPPKLFEFEGEGTPDA